MIGGSCLADGEVGSTMTSAPSMVTGSVRPGGQRRLEQYRAGGGVERVQVAVVGGGEHDVAGRQARGAQQGHGRASQCTITASMSAGRPTGRAAPGGRCV